MRPAILLSLLVVACGTQPAAHAQAAGSDSSGLLEGRRTIKQFPVNVGRGITGLFDIENVEAFTWGTIAFGASVLIEDDLRDWIIDPDDDASDVASDYLGPVGLGVITAGIFIGGQFSEDLVFRDMSYDLGVAVTSTLLSTAILKETIDRTRPDEGNDKSFPSGHTSNAFAIAAVLDSHYGRRAGVPAYTIASLIGLSRVRRDSHWLSDVVAGAVLGYLTGTTVVRQNSRSGRNISLIPSASPNRPGLTLVATF